MQQKEKDIFDHLDGDTCPNCGALECDQNFKGQTIDYQGAIALSRQIEQFMTNWLLKNKGKRVKTPGGKFKGRIGVVDGVLWDMRAGWSEKPQMCVLVMVLDRKGEKLNSTGDSRTYWPLDKIEEFHTKQAA